MSVKDNDKIIILSSALTGKIIIQIPYDDINISHEYLSLLVHRYIENGEGILIKIGSRA